jgi:hypothetical protein
MENQELYHKAQKRVEARMGFYIHLLVYLGVNTLLLAVNLTTSRDSLWFYWPLLGWGIGLLFHGLGVFVFSGPSSWKERMIRKEMDKERRRQF